MLSQEFSSSTSGIPRLKEYWNDFNFVFFRELPECIFTSEAYPKLFEAYAIQDAEQRSRTYLHLFSQLPQNPSQACIVFLIEHLVRVAALDGQNKMSLHNLATVFGPTMLHAGPGRGNPAELLANSTRYPSSTNLSLFLTNELSAT